MRDRIKKTPEAAGSSLVPIGLFQVMRVVPVLFLRERQNKLWWPYRTKKMIAAEPIEFHQFWRRLVKGD